jgi:tetrathionate reductase subunit B
LKYALLVDTTKCSLCFACQVACKDEYVGNKYLPFSYPQPDVEQEWVKIQEIEKGQYPYVKVYPIPVRCAHCDNAPCIEACPVPGAIYKAGSGAVIIDPQKCSPEQCRTRPCIEKCPYQVVFFNRDSNIAQKCTLCMHRIKAGQPPACVDACPSNVYIFGAEAEIRREAEKRGARVLHPEQDLQPRTFYLGLPSPTLAGHLMNQNTLMDLTGATVTLKNLKTGITVTNQSDISGNISLEGLDLGHSYSLEITNAGFQPRILQSVKLEIEYQHLGDIKVVPSKTSPKRRSHN